MPGTGSEEWSRSAISRDTAYASISLSGRQVQHRLRPFTHETQVIVMRRVRAHPRNCAGRWWTVLRVGQIPPAPYSRLETALLESKRPLMENGPLFCLRL